MENSNLGNSFKSYYQTINNIFLKYYNKYLMLHYPYFREEHELLEQRQSNLLDHCLFKLSALENKIILDIGSGNGTESIYIYDKYNPSKIIGVDLNPDNILIAKKLQEDRNIEFRLDDAQHLASIPDHSIDVVICIESAFHFPNKDDFLNQIHRVLKDGGEFLIADILTKSYKKRRFIGKWKRRMHYYHWTENDYIISFSKSGLVIYEKEEVTKKIIKGFKGYSFWLKNTFKKKLYSYLKLLVLMYIQVNLNVYLLKKRRKYFIFHGGKFKSI